MDASIKEHYFTLRPDLGLRHVKPEPPAPATMFAHDHPEQRSRGKAGALPPHDQSLKDVIKSILQSVKRIENGKVVQVYPPPSSL